MKNIKGQVSTELIVIIAAIMVIFIPLMVTVYLKASGTEETVSTLQAQLAATRIANMINTIGNLGDNSSSTLEIYLPKNTEKIEFNSYGEGSEITITLTTNEGPIELSESAKFKILLESSFDQVKGGKIRIELRSSGDQIKIRRKS
ncbi:MAG TPA: hypothetical protein VI912_01345 [Candidatus Bilamarchaeaceae archaeon]|nr:hypothetical protein [Candidatus Bilamarchaeaceae archaeon]